MIASAPGPAPRQTSHGLQRQAIARDSRLPVLGLLLLVQQPQYAPLLLAEEVVSLFAAIEGLWDDVPTEKVKGFSDKLLANFRLNDAGLMAKINKDRKLDEDMLKEMRQKIVEYKKVLV